VAVQRYTAEQVVAALNETKGLPAVAAEKLGCTVSTIYNYAKRYETVRAALTHQKEKRLDIAEGQLWSLINAGNITAIIFYLKTQGKHRGYVERQEVKVSGEDIDAAIENELARLATRGQAEVTGETAGDSDPAGDA